MLKIVRRKYTVVAIVGNGSQLGPIAVDIAARGLSFRELIVALLVCPDCLRGEIAIVDGIQVLVDIYCSPVRNTWLGPPISNPVLPDTNGR